MLDVREAARVAGRTPETVRRWIWTGRLTARRHGTKLLVARQAIDELLRGDSAAPMSLADWAKRVDERRRAGVLGDRSEGASAADLVLSDRASRQAG